MVSGGGCTPPPNCSQRIKTMNSFNLDQNPYKDVIVEIVFVTPEMAADMVSKNYEHNRDIIKSNLLDIQRMMKSGTFVLSPDALVFDQDGVMLNGNHRTTSVIETGLGQWFVVMRNVSHEIGLVTDTGKSRTMSDRLNFRGIEISRKQCSVIRHALCDISSPTVGTMQYSKNYQDEFVGQQFLRFKDYFDMIDSNNYVGTKFNPFFLGAGLKIYAGMRDKEQKGHSFIHGMNAVDRTKHWIEITCLVHPDSNPYNSAYDSAASRVCLAKKEKRDTEAGAGYWNDVPCLRKSIYAAHKFMNGEPIVRNLLAVTRDPFTPLSKLPATASNFSDDEQE